jgi:hypothetical protein
MTGESGPGALSPSEHTGEEPISEGGPSIPEEILEGVPPEARGHITQAMRMAMGVTPVFHPVLQRITSEHIGKVIDNQDLADQRSHGADASSRRYFALFFMASLIAAVGLIVLFGYLERFDVVAAIVTGFLGFGGGFGLGVGRRHS